MPALSRQNRPQRSFCYACGDFVDVVHLKGLFGVFGTNMNCYRDLIRLLSTPGLK